MQRLRIFRSGCFQMTAARGRATFGGVRAVVVVFIVARRGDSWVNTAFLWRNRVSALRRTCVGKTSDPLTEFGQVNAPVGEKLMWG